MIKCPCSWMLMDLTFTTVVLHGYNLPAYASLQKGVVDRCRVSAQPEKRSVQSKQKLLGFVSEIGLTLKKKSCRRWSRMMSWGLILCCHQKQFHRRQCTGEIQMRHLNVSVYTWILHESEAYIGKASKGDIVVLYFEPLATQHMKASGSSGG